MSKPLYFDAIDAEACYPMDIHRDNMEADDVTERTLCRALPIPTSQAFYCREYGEVFEGGVGVCHGCDAYEPRNGKNGRCRFHTHCYEPGEAITVKHPKKP